MMRWVRHVELRGRRQMHKGFGGGNLQKSDYLKYLGMHWGLIQRWILKKQDGRALSRVIGPKTAQDLLNTKMNIQIP
jgi:hypothetical protein